MISKLRRRFILITVLAVVVFVSLIIAVINVTNFIRVTDTADRILDAIVEGDGHLPPVPSQGPIDLSTRNNARYFWVKYNSNGSIKEVNTKNVALISDEAAKQLGTLVRNKGIARGFSADYRYLVTKDGSMVVFVDTTRMSQSADTFMIDSIIVAAVSLVLVSLLIFVVSRRALKPIVEGYEKQKRFITEASHELKTPLTVISANNELLEMECGENEYTRAISKQVEKMVFMTQNLTALARLDEGRTLDPSQEFSLSDTILDVCHQFRPALEASGKVFEHSVANVTYKGHQPLLQQLTSILLDNATKYSHSYVNLSLTAEGKHLVLTVKNDVVDTPDGDMSKCFERFYRSDTARTQAGGSGLGLAIAQEIVNLHRATIAAQVSCGEFIIKVQL